MNDIGFLDVLGVRYRVVTLPAPHMAEGRTGQVDLSAAVITLQESLDLGVARNTLFHELVHVVAWLVGMDLNESQTQALSIGLSSIPQLLIEPDPFPVK